MPMRCSFILEAGFYFSRIDFGVVGISFVSRFPWNCTFSTFRESKTRECLPRAVKFIVPRYFGDVWMESKDITRQTLGGSIFVSYNSRMDSVWCQENSRRFARKKNFPRNLLSYIGKQNSARVNRSFSLDANKNSSAHNTSRSFRVEFADVRNFATFNLFLREFESEKFWESNSVFTQRAIVIYNTEFHLNLQTLLQMRRFQIK